jgi:hypothetical protein
MTPWRLRLYVYDTLLERLAQDFQDVAAALRHLVEKHNPVGRQRHLAWHRHRPPTAQPDVRNGVVRSATRVGGDEGGAVASEIGARWMHIVSMASARVMVGRMVVSRWASLSLRRFGTGNSLFTWDLVLGAFADQGRCLFGDHQGGGIRGPTHDRGHDGRIDDPQPVDPVHPQ